jgi:hypothetical protein
MLQKSRKERIVIRGLARIGGISVGVLALGLYLILNVGAENNSAKTLFETRCSMCYPTDRPLGKTKTAGEWRETVSRMQQHAAGQISDEDRETIIQYLSEIRGK